MEKRTITYNADDIMKSFAWLGHAQYGFTELVAFHPGYRPGRESFQYNLKHDLLPKIWYVKTKKQVLSFVARYHQDHTCCYGINPRVSILKNTTNHVRSAKDADIEIVMNLYLDFDCIDTHTEQWNLFMLEELLHEIEAYLKKENISTQPVRAFTGNGYHLLFAVPPIKVNEHSDIGERLKKFREGIYNTFSDDMKREGIRLDSTMDLRRVAKMYGTRKPFPQSKLSSFYGSERIEDHALREYLLSLPLTDPPGTGISIRIPEKLPDTFKNLLSNDSVIQGLWNNKGKGAIGDISSTGYDFSLAKECIQRGITDINDLFAILALRPEGAFQKSGKNEHYIRRTIGNAVFR